MRTPRRFVVALQDANLFFLRQGFLSRAYSVDVLMHSGDWWYTAQTGLPYFDCAAVVAIGSWYYVLALESMAAEPCFHSRSVNIGPSYAQLAVSTTKYVIFQRDLTVIIKVYIFYSQHEFSR